MMNDPEYAKAEQSRKTGKVHCNGIKLGLKQALEMHKLKVVQECEW